VSLIARRALQQKPKESISMIEKTRHAKNPLQERLFAREARVSQIGGIENLRGVSPEEMRSISIRRSVNAATLR
jgi:hypothetical protein